MPARLVLVALVGALAFGVPASAAPAPSFTAPVRLGFKLGDDWEPAIAADRSGHVYAVWSHYVDFSGSGSGEPDPSCPTCASPHTDLQVSSDGGRTWSGVRALAPSTERQDDPQIVVDVADGRTVYASFMESNKASEYVMRSDDFGQTWNGQFGISVDYNGTGSTQGRIDFNNGTVDFAASDIPFQLHPEDGSAPEQELDRDPIPDGIGHPNPLCI